MLFNGTGLSYWEVSLYIHINVGSCCAYMYTQHIHFEGGERFPSPPPLDLCRKKKPDKTMDHAYYNEFTCMHACYQLFVAHNKCSFSYKAYEYNTLRKRSVCLTVPICVESEYGMAQHSAHPGVSQRTTVVYESAYALLTCTHTLQSILILQCTNTLGCTNNCELLNRK